MKSYFSTHGLYLSEPRVSEVAYTETVAGPSPYVCVRLGQYLTGHVKDAVEADRIAAAFTEAGRKLREAEAAGGERP